MKKLLIPGFALALSGAAIAQGDLCSTATAISGFGTHTLDTTILTTSGFSGGGSCSAGAATIYQDGFYQWTATAAGDYVFDTNTSSFDTKISIHSGVGCAATCVAYDDDGGVGTQSLTSVAGITVGQTFLIQVGGYGTNSGAAVLNIGLDPCSGTDDTLEDNDTCSAPATLTAGTYTNLITRAIDTDFYSVSIPAGDQLSVDHLVTNGAFMDFGLYDGSCNFLETKFGNFTYSNLSASPTTLIFEAYSTSTTPTCAEYELTLSLAPDPCFGLDDTFEDNDTCGTAASLTAGTHVNLYTRASDTDYYSVSIPAGQRLSVDHTVNNGAFMDFGLYDGSCNFLVTKTGNFTYSNLGASPLTLIFEAYSTSTAPSCANYDLTVSYAPDPCAGSDDSLEDNDDCATARPMVDGTYPGLFVAKVDKDHYSFCVADGATVAIDVLFTHLLGDVDAFLYDAADANCGLANLTTALVYGFSSSDNETLSWTNNTGAALDCVLEVNVYINATLECNHYDLVISGSGGCTGGSTGTPFCDPMNPNSTGASTTLTGTMGSGIGSGLHLEATSGPNTQFGYFLVGTAATSPGLTLSQGRLCLDLTGGNALGRYNVAGTSANSVGSFNASGVMTNLVGTSAVGTGFDVPSMVPIAGNPSITAGSTWHFQLWHRENLGASNFSNGLSVTF